MTDTILTSRTAGSVYDQPPSFVVDHSYWGFVVADRSQPLFGLIALQWLAVLFGSAFVAAALVMVVLPDMVNGSGDILVRACAGLVMGGLGGMLISYASRGIKPELHVDTKLGELRLVVRNRAGAATLLGRYGFDAVQGIDMGVTARTDEDVALLVYVGGMDQPLKVASGAMREIQKLKALLNREIC